MINTLFRFQSFQRSHRAKFMLATGLLSLATVSCGGGDANLVPSNFSPRIITAETCAGTTATPVAATQIGLPTNGAAITSATLVLASSSGNANGQFCKILGMIKPVDPTAPVINFEVNLPSNWNGKFVQVGGGGFDGVLITGLDPLNFAPETTPPPLALGYATFGDDSGHVGGITTGKFAVNDEALANYGRQSLKKTHDVALVLMTRLYQVDKPLKRYFVGSSTGGRDALSVVQTWPDDYDAILINRPAHNYTGLRLSNIQLGRSLFLNDGAGWINPTETTLLLDSVMNSCDSLDGLRDGIISNLDACKAKSDNTLTALRCINGADTGDTCLSDAQIATVKTMASPLALAYPLANGVTTYGGYNIMAGMVFGPPYSTSRNFGPNKTGPAAPNYLAVASGSSANAPNAYVTGDQWMKYFITRDASFNTLTVDPTHPGAWQKRIVDVSNLTDSASTNLDRFLQKGGRIVWTHGSADEVVSTDSSVDYYKQLVSRYGQSAVDASIRFYLVYGNGHGNTGPFIPAFDSLGILSDWLEKRIDPADNIVAVNIQTKAATDTSPGGTAARPLCRYPAWPKYIGDNKDPNLSTSFICATQ